MTFHLDPCLPLLVVSNFAEAHLDFLSRAPSDAERCALLEAEDRHADRTLLWLRDDKLVLVSHDIPHAAWLLLATGNHQTRFAAPRRASRRLSLDILDDPECIARILDFAGPERRLQIVPYATTPEFLHLANTLRAAHGVDVLLPESPAPRDVWVRDFTDTKAGFHLLASRWLPREPRVLVEAYVCRDVPHAAAVAYWFVSRGEACIVKPDTGESGIGVMIVRPGRFDCAEAIADWLAPSSYWADEPIIVEQFVASPGLVSPSAEVVVPLPERGEPRITYISTQLFKNYGEFCGVLVSRSMETEPWYSTLCDRSLVMARNLQEMGYVGHFDIDCIVDADGHIFLLELNARRTGGTHVHEFALNRYGPDYLARVSLLSLESVDSGGIREHTALLAALDDLLFPIDGDERGVIVSIAGTLSMGLFGAVVVGRDDSDLFALREQMLARFVPHGLVTR